MDASLKAQTGSITNQFMRTAHIAKFRSGRKSGWEVTHRLMHLAMGLLQGSDD